MNSGSSYIIISNYLPITALFVKPKTTQISVSMWMAIDTSYNMNKISKSLGWVKKKPDTKNYILYDSIYIKILENTWL